MENSRQGYGFGTFKGVFTPSILTIIGVVMYLRFGWVLGSVGLSQTLIIVTISSLITLLTGFSVSALATNMRMKGGGAYFMVSRSFGVEVGAAIGIPLFLSQAVSVAFYVVGFVEAFTLAIPVAAGWDPRLIGLVSLILLAAVATFSADWALKSQYVIMAFIAASLVSFFFGSSPQTEAIQTTSSMAADKSHGFWHVLAVFFPAVTGILSGVGMSGDLKKPSRSLPLGTIAAVLTGWIVYMSVPIALDIFVSDKSVLLTDSMIMQKCARIPWLIVAGVWAASLSSALGGLLAAPRFLQALSNDGALPSFIGKGYGKTNDPYIASVLGMSLAGIGIWYGDVNLLAPILTIFNLTAYALLNLSAAFEEFMGNPSWRPSFRIPSVFSFLGFIGCVGMMFMISPGATIAAVIGICLIWFVMSRRTMHARWGDMRTGLLVYLVHVILRRIAKRSDHTHAWRPNLLVLSGTPDRRLRIVEFVRTVTGAMSFATFGVVVPSSSWNSTRAKELSNMMRAWLVRHGVDAQVRVIPGDNTMQGRSELMRTYGYGPLEPNTVLLGEMPDLETAKMLNLLVSLKRNAIIMRSEKGALLPAVDNRVTVDVWWRGKSSNASFVLAFAYLLQRGTFGKPAKLRLCHLAEKDERTETVRNYLDKFIAETRIKAEIVIVPPSSMDLYEKIAEISKSSSLVFLGLRTPRKDEPVEAYATYLNSVKEKTTALPHAIFACAAEDIDFKNIFKE